MHPAPNVNQNRAPQSRPKSGWPGPAADTASYPNDDTTRSIRSPQPATRPRVPELTAADELVTLENMVVPQQNGFEVGLEVDEPAGRWLRMLSHSHVTHVGLWLCYNFVRLR